MFNKAGTKIKKLTKAITALGLVLVAVLAIAAGVAMPLLGILVLILGALCVWCGGLFIYGFGEVVEVATGLNESRTSVPEQPTVQEGLSWQCENCGQVNRTDGSFCKKCGASRNKGE